MALQKPNWPEGYTPSAEEWDAWFSAIAESCNLALQNRGNWDASKTYNQNDAVRHSSALFYALRAVAANVEPGAAGSQADWIGFGGSGGSGGAVADDPQAANLVKAGPVAGGVAAPSYRALVPADLPNASTNEKGAVQLAADGAATPGRVPSANDKRLKVMTGATAQNAGAAGLAPAAAAGEQSKFLRGDGTYADAGSSGGGASVDYASATFREGVQDVLGTSIVESPTIGAVYDDVANSFSLDVKPENVLIPSANVTDFADAVSTSVSDAIANLSFPNGDMTQAVYDTSGDGIVDHAAFADSAGAVNWANISQKPDLPETGAVLLHTFAMNASSSFMTMPPNGLQLPDLSGAERFFKSFLMIGVIRAQAVGATLALTMNGDTAANYDTLQVVTSGSAQVVTTTRAATSIALGPVAPSAAGDTGGATQFRIQIGNVQGVFHRTLEASIVSIDNSAITMRSITGRWKNSAILSTINFVLSAGNWQSNSYMSIYGLA